MDPPSYMSYTITLAGSGVVPVNFNYLYSQETHASSDAAYLVYDSGTGLQEVANFSTVVNTEQTFSGSFEAGHTIGFLIVSDNDAFANFLQVSAVPEPSALALMGLGAAAILWQARRRSAKG